MQERVPCRPNSEAVEIVFRGYIPDTIQWSELKKGVNAGTPKFGIGDNPVQPSRNGAMDMTITFVFLTQRGVNAG